MTAHPQAGSAARRRVRSGDRGFALLLVLLLVAVMSVIAVSLLDDVRFAIRRTMNAETIGQAQWYALGAETMARGRLRKLVEDPSAAAAAAREAFGRRQSFPIDHGAVSLGVVDATTCFNLNSLVQAQAEGAGRNEIAIRQFEALLRSLGIADEQALSNALIDWIDSDGIRPTDRFEDDAYVRRRLGLPANDLLAEPTEIRAVIGYSDAVYARLRPYVCATPTAGTWPLNVNTLPPQHAVLLTALTQGKLSEPAARKVLQERPAAGWTDQASFWRQPALSELELPDGVAEQVAVVPRYVRFRADVSYAGADVTLTSMIALDTAAGPRTVARRWTPEE